MPLLGIFPCNGILGGSDSIFKRTNWNLWLDDILTQNYFRHCS